MVAVVYVREQISQPSTSIVVMGEAIMFVAGATLSISHLSGNSVHLLLRQLRRGK
jgi:hypothetical protein